MEPGWRAAVAERVPKFLERLTDDTFMLAADVAAGAEDVAWLAGLAEPRVQDWQIEDERRRRKQKADRDRTWKRHRAEFTGRIEALGAGD